MAKIVLSAEVCVQRGVSPRGRADGPRAPDVVRRGRDRVVAALAESGTDGMDRRQVQDVESHPGNARQLRLHAAKSGEGTGEELVPRAVRRPGAVDLDGQLARVARSERPLRVARHQREQLIAPDLQNFFVRLAVAVEDAGEVLEALPIARLRARRGGANHLQANEELDVDVALRRFDPFAQIAMPGEEVIDPSFEGEGGEAESVEGELGAPAVVD